MPSPTIAASLYLTRTLAQGPQHALGTEVMLGGSTLEQILYYVTTATGDIAGGPMFASTSSETAVTIPANSGEQVWVYVLNDSGADLERGDVLVRKAASSAMEVRLSATISTPGQVIGVPQHTIADDVYGWVLRKGVGEVLTDAAGSTVDVGIKVSNATAGTAEFAAVTDGDFGWATETVAAGAATCFINCRG